MLSSTFFLLCLVLVVQCATFSLAIEGSFVTKDSNNNDVTVKYAPVGCFKDVFGIYRALSDLPFNYRASYGIDWSKWPVLTETIVKTCAQKVYEMGYKQAFGVQFYGECWSDSNAEARFSLHGASTNCVSGVGRDLTNFVYRFSVEMKQQITCDANGKSYNTGEEMLIPNDWTSDPLNAKCMKCTCGSDGSPKDCKDHIYCELGQGPLCAKYKNVTGQCCPKCDCLNVDGQVMKENDEWLVKNDKGECSECKCLSNGVADCTARTICKCLGEEQPNPGKCCPLCVEPTTTTQAPVTFIVTTERPPPTFPPFPTPP